MVTGLSGVSSVSVAVTVASVGPYEFRMRRPGRYQRFTRFCGQASPPTSRMRSSGRSCSMVASSVGQQAMTVTRCSRRNWPSSSPSIVTPGFAGTSVAPAIIGTQISSIEKSKAIVMP